MPRSPEQEGGEGEGGASSAAIKARIRALIDAETAAARAGRPTPPSMTLADQVAAVQQLLALCVEHRASGHVGDVRLAGGAIS